MHFFESGHLTITFDKSGKRFNLNTLSVHLVGLNWTTLGNSS